jgi:hypothetical protein
MGKIDKNASEPKYIVQHNIGPKGEHITMRQHENKKRQERKREHRGY